MGTAQTDRSLGSGSLPQVPLRRGIAWGLLGGLAGTLVMDIVLMCALRAAGLPALSCFSIVGDTAASFFSLIGIQMSGGVPSGVAAHYLIGPVIGIIFGIALVTVEALRVDNRWKGIVFAVLYIEILSQPILATTPILLKMTAAETIQWFGGSFVMHFLLGVVLGAVAGCGLRVAPAEDLKRLKSQPGVVRSLEVR